MVLRNAVIFEMLTRTGRQQDKLVDMALRMLELTTVEEVGDCYVFLLCHM